jgi:hypothetical protein
MKQLDLEVKANGRTYTQIKRDSYRAIYQSDEGYYEVFRIDVKPDMEIFGTIIPEHEHYPTTNEFGIIAWCTRYRDKAEDIYKSIEPKKERDD